MAYRITDECVKCGVCVDECPAEAIFEGEYVYLIDQDICTECESCVSSCPNEAIIEE